MRPRLEYASAAWSPQTAGKKKQLETVQKKAARFVTRDYSRETKSENLVHHLNWDPLEARRNSKDVVMWFKIHHHLVHLPFPSSVVLKPRISRHDHDLAYLQVWPRIDAYRFSFFVCVVPLWNGLPPAAVAVGAEQPRVFQRLALDHFRVQAGTV